MLDPPDLPGSLRKQTWTKNCYFPKPKSKSGHKKDSDRFRASCRRRASLGLRFISFLSGLTQDPPRSRIFVFLVKYFIWFYYPGLASCPPHYAVTSEKNENDDYSRKGAYHINHRHRLSIEHQYNEQCALSDDCSLKRGHYSVAGVFPRRWRWFMWYAPLRE